MLAPSFWTGKDELETAIEAALKVKDELKLMPFTQKYEILVQICHLLIAKKKELIKVLSQESGKSLFYAFGEIDNVAHPFLIAAEESKRLPKEYIPLDSTLCSLTKESAVRC